MSVAIVEACRSRGNPSRAMHVSFHHLEDATESYRAAAALRGDEVQVWTATLPSDDHDCASLAHALSADEQQRAARFLLPAARRQFVFARALLRQLVAACVQTDPAALAFAAAPRGKPLLEHPTADVRFNLAHSGAMVAVALARRCDVGADLEAMRPLSDRSALAARIFSLREWAAFHALPEPLRQQAFYNGWTRKEAYLKATGAGLSEDLAAIEVTLAPGADARLLALRGDAEVARRWAMRAIPLPPGYAGAVVFEAAPLTPPATGGR